MKQPIVIVGMGKSGRAALRLLRLLGHPDHQLKTFDSKTGAADFSQPEKVLDLNPACLVVSPGVDLKLPWIQTLLRAGTKLTSELDLAAQQLKDEKLVGITGSMGKSTTTTLLGIGASSFSQHVFTGGNLGTPLSDYIGDVLERQRPRAEWILLELSSYQLENCPSLKLQAGIITALSPNHLERYLTLEDYYLSKWSFKGKIQGPLFLNFDNEELKRWSTPRLDSQCACVRAEITDHDTFSLQNAKLVGAHNLQNLALATEVARHFNWPTSAIEAMKNYRGLEHRLERVATKEGVTFINDSKATTIDSVIAAVHSCLPLLNDSQNKLHLLLGGRDKSLPWEDLQQFKRHPQLEFYFFGECGEVAQYKSGLKGSCFKSLSDTLGQLNRFLRSNDLVLLSPGGTSLDEFKNFEDRGHYFKNWVQGL